MELKKNPSRDIHKRYPLHLVAGLCISCGLVIGLFELQFRKQPYNRPDPSEWDGPLTLLNTNVVCDCELPVPEKKRREPVPIIRTELTSTIAVATTPVEETQPVNQDDPFEPTQVPIAVPAAPLRSDEPLLMAEEMPEPIDGFQKFYKQLGRDLRYPRKAAAHEIEGKVFVEFVIDRTGNITVTKVIRGIGYGCDEEAVKALMKTKWKPGKQRGVPVKVRMIMPIKFSLTN